MSVRTTIIYVGYIIIFWIYKINSYDWFDETNNDHLKFNKNGIFFFYVQTQKRLHLIISLDA